MVRSGFGHIDSMLPIMLIFSLVHYSMLHMMSLRFCSCAGNCLPVRRRCLSSSLLSSGGARSRQPEPARSADRDRAHQSPLAALLYSIHLHLAFDYFLFLSIGRSRYLSYLLLDPISPATYSCHPNPTTHDGHLPQLSCHRIAHAVPGHHVRGPEPRLPDQLLGAVGRAMQADERGCTRAREEVPADPVFGGMWFSRMCGGVKRADGPVA